MLGEEANQKQGLLTAAPVQTPAAGRGAAQVNGSHFPSMEELATNFSTGATGKTCAETWPRELEGWGEARWGGGSLNTAQCG